MLSNGALARLAALDGAARRTARVGVLLPWANVAVETELPRLGLRNTSFHYARLVPESRTTAIDSFFWNGLRSASGQALDALTHVPLDSAVLACTSAGFTAGPELPSRVVTAFDALLAALAMTEARRVVLATPYPDAVTEAERAALERSGVAVLAHANLGLSDGYADITALQVRQAVDELPGRAVGGADALVLSCTGWHTLSEVDGLEARLGKPVLSSNLAVALWGAARLGALA